MFLNSSLFNVPLADSALGVDSGVVGLTVKDAGHDLFYCVLLSLASHCGDLGNDILCLNASYLFLVKFSFLFSVAFCCLLHGVFALLI